MKRQLWTVLAFAGLLGFILGCGGTGKPTVPEKSYTPAKDRPSGSAPPPPIPK